jgi:hypothetical protein
LKDCHGTIDKQKEQHHSGHILHSKHGWFIPSCKSQRNCSQVIVVQIVGFLQQEQEQFLTEKTTFRSREAIKLLFFVGFTFSASKYQKECDRT